MKNFILIIICFVFVQSKALADQKNIVKLNVMDCSNCTIALSGILQKDPQVTFIIDDEYVLDSVDVIEKFNLRPYNKNIVWSGKVYDSLSKIPESELIQYCGTQEISRSGLKTFHFIESKNCVPESAANNESDVCIKGLPNHLVFFDYKNYMIITNYMSSQQYVYNKTATKIKTVKIDSNLVKSIYFDYMKDPEMYKHYMHMTNVAAMFKPKIVSMCPYNDSTVLGCLITYKCDSVTIIDSFYSRVPSVLKISTSGTSKIDFIKRELPIPYHSLNEQMLSYKDNLYFTLVPEVDGIVNNKQEFKNLVKYKKGKQAYEFDRAVSTTLNDYLITNQVYQNYNRTYFDNGYSLMSLSNYLINLDTEEKIYLPLPESVFKGIHISNMKINYCVYDFKYNKSENRFYIYYSNDGGCYVASFKPHAKTFDSNEKLYTVDNKILDAVKNICLSWDGTKLLYSLKNDECFKYATVQQMQELGKSYKNWQK